MEEEKIKDPEDNNDGIPDLKFNAQPENDKKNEFLSSVDKVIIMVLFTINDLYIHNSDIYLLFVIIFT